MPSAVSKLVLFDIDGTLLLTDGAGRRAIRRAMAATLGGAGLVDGVRFDGKTDPQIVRELLQAAQHHHAEDVERIWGLCEEYVALLESELSLSASVRLLDGVETLLEALDQRTDTVLGLLTGNMAAGARLKLTYAGLDPDRFRVGAFGSDAMERRELPAFAARRASAIMGTPPSGQAMVIIGDTPNDMVCGADLGARAIGVATGSYTGNDLRDAGAFAVFDDLSDTEAVVAAIYE
jgi:phosphoglycolate phosphatase-like HAD superfamily hydrolase